MSHDRPYRKDEVRSPLRTSSTKNRRLPGYLLAAGLALGMGWASIGLAAEDCGASPCPGTLPAIWPQRSATIGNTMSILGWNLAPNEEYQIVVVAPDNESIIWNAEEFVVTDEEGDFLGDEYDLPPEEAATLPGRPHQIFLDDLSAEGTYEVRAYLYLWNGDLEEPPVATTTFYHN